MRGAGLLMDAPFPALLEEEVLHGVGYVNGGAINPCFLKGAIEQLACWPDKRPPHLVLLIARLFAYKHDRCGRPALAKDGLTGIQVQVTALAGARRRLQFAEGMSVRQKWPRGMRVFLH